MDRIKLDTYLEDLERTHAVLVLRAAAASRDGRDADALVREREAAQVMRDINRVRLLRYGMPQPAAEPQPHPSSILGGCRYAEPTTPAKS